MSRPVVIIEPLSSGIELAPAFRARGFPVLAVKLGNPAWKGFGSELRASDFLEVIPDQPGLEDILRGHDPIAIIPGMDDGVPLAERLTSALTPRYANDPRKSRHRQHKALMQQALKEAGVPFLKTLDTAAESEAELWLRDNGLVDQPLIIKPPCSAGSDKVFHVAPGGDWKKAFNRVLSEPSKITGEMNGTVVVQEQAVGTEYAVGTVSAAGKHSLVHLIKYTKTSAAGRETVFDHVEFVRYAEGAHGPLFDYAKQALDALGIRWGAAHSEIMLTPRGPRLIESGARMCGGPVVGFARVATGSSQADKWVEAVVDGAVRETEYAFKKTVMPVFLKSPLAGVVSNVEVFKGASSLPTLLEKFIWIRNGDLVPQTVDYLTSIGIVALAGERDEVLADYRRVREMEARLRLD